MAETAPQPTPAEAPRKDGRGGARPNSGPRAGVGPYRAQLIAERDQLQATANALAAELESVRQANAPVRQSPVDILEDIAAFWMGVAAQEQAEATKLGRKPNMGLVADALDRASSASGRAAPFRASRLASVDIGGKKDSPIEHSVVVKVSAEEAQL